ncbi:unnamed protein product [Chrysoparadoxa australica]
MMNDAVGTGKDYLTPLDAFVAFDIDGGGSISPTEFRQAVQALAPATSEWGEERMDQLFAEVDKDGSGEIDYTEFNQVWLRIVDAEAELQRRGIKPVTGLRAKQRNIKKLAAAVAQDEKETEEMFKRERGRMDDLRQRARVRRDEKRKKRQQAGGKLGLQDAKEDADRRKQRRLMIQKEQKERARQRLEQKIQQNLVAHEQAAAKARQQSLTKQARLREEQDRVAAVRRRREDQLWLGHASLRTVPLYLMEKEWRAKLSDLVLLDLQDNRITELPANGFLYLMSSLRKLDLQKNRLKELPAEEFGNLFSLQILHLDCNQLAELPDTLGNLEHLEHLTFANNNLTSLPEGIERLTQLRWLCRNRVPSKSIITP